MRNFVKLALVAGALLFLPSCAGNVASTPTPPASESAPTVTISDQAMFAAETSYNVVGQAFVAAVEAKAITPTQAATIRPKLVTMYDALKAARAARATLDALGFAKAVGLVETLRGDVTALLPASRP